MTDFPAHLRRIGDHLAAYRDGGKRIFATTSCQTNSVVLLHILSTVAPDTPVYFLNTGYHFPETLAFKRDLAARLGLSIHDLFSVLPRSQQRVGGRFLFTSDPDYCCHINKILPLKPILSTHDVWINGIRAGQSAVRQAMGEERKTGQGVLRYHPILSWTDEMVAAYIEANQLPRHPLEAAGYRSLGCRPCTRPPSPGDERDGRWVGMKKTECGLHTDLG
ncbi:MAG: phosphoadenosine phosphosulfate reductase [Myxococcota bacterium]|jgi:phosphoadenosine phosphosulfate reductase